MELQKGDRVRVLLGVNKGRVGEVIFVHDCEQPLPYVVGLGPGDYSSYEAQHLQKLEVRRIEVIHAPGAPMFTLRVLGPETVEEAADGDPEW